MFKKIQRQSRNFVFSVVFIFLFAVVFAIFPRSGNAVDGLFNGKFLTGETDDYLLWLQTYNNSLSPYYFDHFYINKSGYTGIGTTSPQALLDVNGLIKMRSSTITANEDVVNKGYLDSALASTTAGIITQVATSSFWQGSLTGNVYNANTGNIGIGISNPSEKFVVAGSQQDTTFGIETYSSSNADISEFEFRKSMSNTLGTRLTTTNGAYLGSLMFKCTH